MPEILTVGNRDVDFGLDIESTFAERDLLHHLFMPHRWGMRFLGNGLEFYPHGPSLEPFTGILPPATHLGIVELPIWLYA